MSSPTGRPDLAVNTPFDKTISRCRAFMPGKVCLVGSVCVVRLLMVGVILWAAPASEDAYAAEPNATLTIENVQRAAREAEAHKDIDARTKARIADMSRAAIVDLERVPELHAQAEKYRQQMRSAPDQTRDLTRQLEILRAGSSEASASPFGLGATLDELEQAQAQTEARLAAARSELVVLDLESGRVDSEPTELRNARREAQAGLEQTREEIQIAAGASRDTLLAKTELQAKRAALLVREAQVEVLQSHIDALPLLARLTQLRREVVRAQWQRDDIDLKQLVALVDQRRSDDARRAEQDSVERQRQLVGRSPFLSQLAAANVLSSAQLSETAKEIESLRQARDQRMTEAENLEADYQRARINLAHGKITEPMARVLAERGAALPEAEQFRRERGERMRAAESIAAAAFQVEREQRRLANPEQELDAATRNELARTPPAELTGVRAEATVLLADRRQLLDRLSTSQRTYLSTLDELVTAEDQLLSTAQDYRNLIGKALFWVPVAPLSERSFSDFPQALRWLGSRGGWGDVAESAEREAWQSPWRLLGLFGAVLAILMARKRLLSRMRRSAELEDVAGDRHVTTTVEALATTLLLVAPLPLVIWMSGELIVASSTASEFANAVGEALGLTAWGVLVGLFFLRLCRPAGIAERHFGRDADSVRELRRASRVFTFVVVPLGFINLAASRYDDPIVRASLGRLTHMLALIVCAALIALTFRPRGPVLARFFGAQAAARGIVLKYTAYVLACAVPLGLAVLSATGFYNAAQVLGRLLLISCIIAAAIALFHTLASRWLHDQRDEFVRARAQGAAREVEILTDGVRKNLERPDFASIGAQATQLLRVLSAILLVVAVLVVWHGALPGLSMLNEISLWTYADVEEGQTVERAVTFGGLMLALAIGFVAIVAVKNIGGFLDIAFPERARLSGGSRYAIRTLARYLIVGGAVVTVFSVLGGSWSRIQWLVAAMGVGLGFGLQEIFANFVSGLIILFERPIRIGDTVTVADVSGVVTRVQARATTVTDFDRKEVVIPNKTVITERVVNWTLSDPITRVVLKVGVAYGSDTVRTCDLLLNAVSSVPYVLLDPAPGAFFLAFGESTLDFEARFFVDGVDRRLRATHDVLTAIERQLRQAGIEIPFPQRDVHLKSAPSELTAQDAMRWIAGGVTAPGAATNDNP
ncbi:mechanosensitive ion channel domain-containing protein [Paraburkholderia sediminicola]|uniref:mechanosensitive ion channel domain-containing protein n=1 Tax=Paraburkholderia sediminicola TaxID=458836 RepID=UPI0038BAC328